MPIRFVVALLLALSSSLTLRAQLPHAPKIPCDQAIAGLSFDVVTIHPSPPPTMNNESSSINSGGDRVRAENVRLTQLIQFALELPEEQITGLSGPVASAHFDLEAKVIGADPNTPVKLTDHQLQCLIVPMLADRFLLKTHIEQKVESIYELVQVKSGVHLAETAKGAPGGSMNMNGRDHAYTMTAKGISMADLARSLSQTRHRPVLDATHLDGLYDFTLKWSADDASPSDADAAPGIVTALQEQLGLKLQSAKGPVDTLVVDHVEMPSEN